VSSDRTVRWRLVLGGDGGGMAGAGGGAGGGDGLTVHQQALDAALGSLYDDEHPKGADLSGSSPRVTRWLGDIRELFPAPVVTVMQRDALDRLGLRRMLTEPELLESIEPDIELVGQLLMLSAALPDKARDTARTVVRRLTDELERRLTSQLRAAVNGALDRSLRTRRPRLRDIDWEATIERNLRHYQPEYRTIIPATLVGHGRRQSSLRDVILCVDQSGSMADSVIHSAVCGSVMASLRAVNTRLVVFDTSVVDLTDEIEDPVDVLFAVQLGGGTDINRAVGYCQGRITRPTDTIFVLISDLFEGGVAEQLLQRVEEMLRAGVTVVVLLALSDRGRPSYDHELAAKLADLGAPAFACTPDQFPGLMAAAIEHRDIAAWAGEAGITIAAPVE
jgi:Mg-chelatase subunit ChlD